MATYLPCALGVFEECVLLKSERELLSTFQEKLYEIQKLPPNEGRNSSMPGTD